MIFNDGYVDEILKTSKNTPKPTFLICFLSRTLLICPVDELMDELYNMMSAVWKGQAH